MLSRTVTVQTKPDATESEYAQATARAIKALLLAVSEEVQVLTFTSVFTDLPPEVQDKIRDALAHKTLNTSGG